MAFADPLVISDDGTAKSLPRSGTSPVESVYRLEDSGGVIHTVALSHDFGSSNGSQRAKKGGGGNPVSARRAVMRYAREFLIADPLLSGQSVRSTVTSTLTVVWPQIVTSSEAAKRGVTIALLATLANLQRMTGGET